MAAEDIFRGSSSGKSEARRPAKPAKPAPRAAKPATKREGKRSARRNPYDTPAIRGPESLFRGDGGGERRVAGPQPRRAAAVRNPYDTPAIRGSGKTAPQVIGRSTITGRPQESAVSALQRADQTSASGFFANLGSDIVETASGVFPGLVHIGKMVASAPVAAYGWAPGELPGEEAAQRFARGTWQQTEQMARAQGSEWAERYGPAASALVRGDFARAGRELGESFYEHPGFMLADIAGLWSGAGAAVGAGGRAVARAAPGRVETSPVTGLPQRVPTTELGQRAARLGSRSVEPGSPRYREPRIITQRLAEDSESPLQSVAVVERGPRSRNPLTRGIQRRVIEPVGERVRREVTRFADELQPAPGESSSISGLVTRPISTRGQFDRAVSRGAREIRLAGEERLAADVADIAERYQRLATLLRPISSGKRRIPGMPREVGVVMPHERDVLHLHLRGVLDDPYLSPRAALMETIATMRQGLEDLRKEGKRTRASERQIARLEAIPDEYLDYNTMPAHLRAAIDEGRTLIDETQRRAVENGYILPETEIGSRNRAVNVLLRGSRYNSDIINWTPQVEAVVGRLLDLNREREAIRESPAPGGGVTPTGPEQGRILRTGAEAANEFVQREIAKRYAQRNIEEAPQIRAEMRAGRAEDAEIAEMVGEEVARVAAEAPSPERRVGLGTVGRHYVRLDRARGAHREAIRRPRERRLYEIRAEMKGQRGRLSQVMTKGGLSPPRDYAPGPRRQTASNAGGRFVPGVPAVRMGGSRPSQGQAVGRVSQERPKRTTEELLRTGRASMSEQLPVLATRRVLSHEQLSENVAQLTDRFAFRDDNGQIATGRRALRESQIDPDRVALVSVRSLRHALERLEDLDQGKGLSRDVIEAVFPNARQLDESIVDASPDDFVAIPKAAMNEWQGAWREPGKVLGAIDSALDLWKSGMLTLYPRWYVNNLVGNVQLFGLLSAGDFRSLLQARKEAFKKRGVIPEEIVRTVAQELGQTERIIGREQNLKRYRNMTQRLFEFNHWMEAFWRRAGYITAAKQTLRDEGGRFRSLSDEELADVLAQMPMRQKRQAVKLTRRFLGDYRNFNAFERNVMKRVFPFYSWMRFMTTLMLTMPVKHPLRTEASVLLSQANQTLNPGDEERPLHLRGRIPIANDIMMRSQGAAPLTTMLPLISAALGGGPGGRATAAGQVLAGSGFGPLWQTIIGEMSGRDPFTGFEYSAPPGYGDTRTRFGFDPMARDPVTGEIASTRITPGLFSQFQQNAPILPLLGSLLAKGNPTYDVVAPLDILRYRLGLSDAEAVDIFRPPPATGRAVDPLPFALGPISSYLGVPLSRVNPEIEEQNRRRREALFEGAGASTTASRLKAALLLRQRGID